MSLFVAGAAFGDVAVSLFVAGMLQCHFLWQAQHLVMLQLFVAGAAFGDVAVSLFVAGAAFGDVGVSTFCDVHCIW